MTSVRWTQVARQIFRVGLLAMAASPLAAHAQTAPSNPVLYDAIVKLQGSVNALQATVNSLQGSVSALGSDVAKREIYRKTVNVPFGNGSGSCNSSDLVVVPAGKRLVIEHVSGNAYFAEAPITLVSAELVAVTDAPGNHTVVEVPAGNPRSGLKLGGGMFNIAAFGQAMTIYTDTPLKVCASSTGPNNNSVSVSIAGYLVNR